MVNLKSCWMRATIFLNKPPSNVNVVNYHETVGTNFHNIYINISFLWDGTGIPFANDRIRVMKFRRRIGNYEYYGELLSRHQDLAYNPFLRKSVSKQLVLFELLGRYTNSYISTREFYLIEEYPLPDGSTILLRDWQLQMIFLENETPSISMYCDEYDCIYDYQFVYSCVPFSNVDIEEIIDRNITIYVP